MSKHQHPSGSNPPEDPDELHAERDKLSREVEKPPKKELEWLTTKERCDQCGAQSYYLVLFGEGQELYFCHNHYKKNEEKLFEVAEDIIDESELLTRR